MMTLNDRFRVDEIFLFAVEFNNENTHTHKTYTAEMVFYEACIHTKKFDINVNFKEMKFV